jgi:hypothetical protein
MGMRTESRASWSREQVVQRRGDPIPDVRGSGCHRSPLGTAASGRETANRCEKRVLAGMWDMG